MARTQAQRDAELALEQAIHAVIKAYQDEDSLGGVVGDWVVVAAETKPELTDETGDSDETAYSVLVKGNQPYYRTAGLLVAGRKYLDIAHDAPDEVEE